MQPLLADADAALFSDATVFNEAAFVWAFASLRSHVHAPLEGADIAIVPIASAVSHARSPNARWEIKNGLFGKEKTLQVVATKDIPNRQAITLDFGPVRPPASLAHPYPYPNPYPHSHSCG